jgi:hypothetical protein
MYDEAQLCGQHSTFELVEVGQKLAASSLTEVSL